jgi:hypothetical protein
MKGTNEGIIKGNITDAICIIRLDIYVFSISIYLSFFVFFLVKDSYKGHQRVPVYLSIYSSLLMLIQ